jgi:hypothetical protein
MRDLISILEDGDLSNDALSHALGVIHDYIIHNDGNGIEEAIAVIHANGYQEVFGAGVYYRALWHDITPEDREVCETFVDLLTHHQMAPRFQKTGGVQGFTPSFDEAAGYVERSMHHNGDLRSFDEDDVDAPIGDAKQVIIIYKVKAPAVVLSMKGLIAFLQTIPDIPNRSELHRALTDPYDGYGSDNEVMIDSATVEIIELHLYED